MNIVLSVTAKIVLCSTGAIITLMGFTCDGRNMRESSVATQGVKTTHTPPPALNQQRWQVPTYKGLNLGKSTITDVERAFGKPIWSGPPEEKLISDDTEDELLYEYENVGGVTGRTTIVLGARTQIVKAIDLYPREPLTLQQVTEQYGSEYIERESKLGPCPTESEIRDFKPSSKREYPIFLVYPEQGMYISVSEDRTATHVGYIFRCP